MSTSPYISRISRIIYRKEEQEFIDSFRTNDSPYYFVYGPPHSGKTELLKLAEKRLRDADRKVAFVSLCEVEDRLEGYNPDILSWYVSLSRLIAKKLDIHKTQACRDHFGRAESEEEAYSSVPEFFFFDFIDDVVLHLSLERVVIIIDHLEELGQFEHKRNACIDGGLGYKLFSLVVNECYGASVDDEYKERFKRLQFIFSSTDKLSDATARFKDESLKHIKFVRLGDFCVDFLKSQDGMLKELSSFNIQERDLDFLHKETNGHPYLMISAINLIKRKFRKRKNNRWKQIKLKLVERCTKYIEEDVYLRFANSGKEGECRLSERLFSRTPVTREFSLEQTRLMDIGIALEDTKSNRLILHNAIFESVSWQVYRSKYSIKISRTAMLKVGAAIIFVFAGAASPVVYDYIVDGGLETNQSLFSSYSFRFLTAFCLLFVAGLVGYLYTNRQDWESIKSFSALVRIRLLAERTKLQNQILTTVINVRKRSWTRWEIAKLSAVTVLIVVLFFPPVSNFVSATFWPAWKEGEHERKATSLLRNFIEAGSPENETDFLQKALYIAQEADDFQQRKSPEARVGESAPLLTLQSIYDSLSESPYIPEQEEVIDNFYAFDIDRKETIASAVKLKNQSNTDNLVVMRKSGPSLLQKNIHNGVVNDIEIVEGADFILTAGSGPIRVWKIASTGIEQEGTIAWPKEEQIRINSIRLLPNIGADGERDLVAIANNGYIASWKVKIDTTEQTFSYEPAHVYFPIQSLTTEKFPNLVRSSNSCLAVSGHLTNSPMERLQVLSIEDLSSESIENRYQVDVGLSPTAMDIDRDGRFIMVSGERKIVGSNNREHVIKFYPLGKGPDNLCRPIAEKAQEKILQERISSPISDIRFSNSGDNAADPRIFVIRGDGSISAYKLIWGATDISENEGDRNLFDFEEIEIENDSIRVGESANPMILPYPNSDTKFLASAGSSRIRGRETGWRKNERYLETFDLQRKFRDANDNPLVSDIISTQKTDSIDSAFAVLLNNGTVEVLGSQFEQPTPTEYRNAQVIEGRNVGSLHRFAVVGSLSDTNRRSIDIYPTLNSLGKIGTIMSRIPIRRNNIDSIAFNPADANSFVFSEDSEVNLVTGINSQSPPPNVSLVTFDGANNGRITSLSLSSDGRILAFLSGDRLVIQNVENYSSPRPLEDDNGIISEEQYEKVKFYFNPKDGLDSFYIFALRKRNRVIDVWAIDDEQSIRRVETLEFRNLVDKWPIIPASQEGNNAAWESWAFDYEGRRLALGSKNEILVFNLEQKKNGGAFDLNDNLIAVYRGKSPELWGNIRHLVFGQAPEGFIGDLVAITDSGERVYTHPGGNFENDLKEWSCEWLIDVQRPKRFELGKKTKRICKDIWNDEIPES